VPDQQLNSRLRAIQPFRVCAQRGSQLIEARSVSGTPSGVSITT
jgi:hypothetical protein